MRRFLGGGPSPSGSAATLSPQQEEGSRASIGRASAVRRAPTGRSSVGLRALAASAVAMFALLQFAAPFALQAAVSRVDLPPLDAPTGTLVLDRNGVLLRPFPVADGRWRLPASLADVDPVFVSTLIAYED